VGYWLGVAGGVSVGISIVLLVASPGWGNAVLFFVAVSVVATIGISQIPRG